MNRKLAILSVLFILAAATLPTFAQQADRWNKPYTPTFGEWVYVWTKANFEELYRSFETEGNGPPEGIVFVIRHLKKTAPFEIRIYAGNGKENEPFYKEWLKTKKPVLEKQVALWKAAGMDISLDDFEITLKASPWQYSMIDEQSSIDIETLNSQTALFKFKNNRLPKGAEELVKEGYLQAVPQPPTPGKYVMDEEGQWSFEPAESESGEAKEDAAPPAAEETEPVIDEQATRTAESLGKIVKLFKSQKGRLPKSLHELVEQDYIPAIPQAPQGKAYKLDTTLGLVDIVEVENATPKSKTFKPLSRAEREAAKSDLAAMKTQMQLFKFKEQRWPKNLQELVDTGLMQNIPDAPGGREWLYDPETGEVRLEGEDL